MRLLVIGAGLMGRAAALDMTREGAEVTLADSNEKRLDGAKAWIGSDNVTITKLDASDAAAAEELMRGHDAVLSAVPYFLNVGLANAAVKAGANFCDLGGNSWVVDEELALHEKAAEKGITIVPDCGLAPGLGNVIAMKAFNALDRVEGLHIRVGGLPIEPKPPLNYQLVFSVHGLVNEYREPARVIRGGKIAEVPSLTELEDIEFDGFPVLEAFQTSGGTSTLPRTLEGQLAELDYKTIRYQGHCEKMKTMFDLGLASEDEIEVKSGKVKPRDVLSRCLELNLPYNGPDLVLMRVWADGEKDGEKKRYELQMVDRHDGKASAMMRTTSYPTSIIAMMMAAGETEMKGAFTPEVCVDPELMIERLRQRDVVFQERWS